jgi:hypothetical protein
MRSSSISLPVWLAMFWSVLLSQLPVSVALPLSLSPPTTAAGAADTTRTTREPKSLFPKTGFEQRQPTTHDPTEAISDKTGTTHPIDAHVLQGRRTARDTETVTQDSNPQSNARLTTALFVGLIVLSVLGVASIAVFGFERMRYCGRAWYVGSTSGRGGRENSLG